MKILDRIQHSIELYERWIDQNNKETQELREIIALLEKEKENLGAKPIDIPETKKPVAKKKSEK